MPAAKAKRPRAVQRFREPPALTVILRSAQAHRDAGLLPGALVLFAVLFNAGLAIINGHVMPISANAVIGMEVSIALASMAVILWNYRPQMLPWFGMIGIIVWFSIERALVVGQFDAKFMRDVLMIATFVLLGMTTPPERVTRLIVILHVIVVGGVLFEAYFTQAYSNLFDIRQYYIATRPFEDGDFWDRSSDLFVSATRPGERFFSFIDLHRTSSVFLEPVSLGNYVVIVTAFVCANYRNLSSKVLAFLLAGNAIALVGCDGRLATVSSALILLGTLIAPRLPRGAAFLYLPASLVGALILIAAMQPDPTEDNFPGRVAYGIELLGRFDIWDWLGNSNRLVDAAADSGIAYTIATHSIIGLVAFWVFLVLNAAQRTPAQIKYLHAVCIYMALTSLVSYSLFSTKTAALLWFIYGSLQTATVPRAVVYAPASSERRAGAVRRKLREQPI